MTAEYSVMIEDPSLPEDEEIGRRGVWTLETDDGRSTVTVKGIFLGKASARKSYHNHDNDYARPSGKCGRCRWFEPRIFRDDNGRYLYHRAGRTIVPGESTRTAHRWLDGPWEVVEALTTRRTDTRTVERDDGTFVVYDQPSVRLSAPAADVLARAAHYDKDLQDAYVNRAVS